MDIMGAMETIIIHPEDLNTIPNSNVLDLGTSKKGSSVMRLSDVHRERTLTLVSNNSQSGDIGQYPTIQVIKKPGVLSEEIQSLTDDIGFLLYPPEYLTPGEKMLRQKLDSERTQRIFTHILPQKMQTGAMADAGVIVHGNNQTESHLFYHKFDDALTGVLQNQSSGVPEMPKSVMYIFRTLIADLIQSFDEILCSYRYLEGCGETVSYIQKITDIQGLQDKIDHWKKSLQHITCGEYEKYVSLNRFNQGCTSIGLSSFAIEEYENLSQKLISREFAERLKIIFELFVENYVKTLWAQENKKNPEISA